MEGEQSYCLLFRESYGNFCGQSHGRREVPERESEFDPRPQESP